MNGKKYQIWVSCKGREELVRNFKVSRQMVNYALAFERNSLLAKQIRAYAVNKISSALLVEKRNMIEGK